MTQGPLIAVIAPGKPAKMLLKLRFSCIRMTTCWIEWFGGGAVGGGVTALVLLQPANAIVASNRRGRRAFKRVRSPSASASERLKVPGSVR